MSEAAADSFSGVKPVDPRQRFDEAALDRWLQGHVEGYAGPLAVLQFKGGQSNPTYRLETPGRAYVLRRKPSGPLLPSAHAVEREFRLISALGRVDFPVPHAFALCEDAGVIGSVFYVMEAVEGVVHWDGSLPEMTAEGRRGVYEAMITTLARLHMSQPPLSRAMRQLEDELGVVLFERTPRGVRLLTTGHALHREARAILDRVDALPARVVGAAGAPTIVVGTCADTADQLGTELVTAFRRRHPQAQLTLHETDLTDPTAGLRADVVDVALARRPFDETGIVARVLRRDPMGVVVPEADPLAARPSVALDDLGGRRWIRLPDRTDRRWSAFWSAGDDGSGGDGPVVRTIQESLHSVLWSSATTLAPLTQVLPAGLVAVPVRDAAPSEIVVAWKQATDNPLVPLFVEMAVEAERARRRGDDGERAAP